VAFVFWWSTRRQDLVRPVVQGSHRGAKTRPAAPRSRRTSASLAARDTLAHGRSAWKARQLSTGTLQAGHFGDLPKSRAGGQDDHDPRRAVRLGVSVVVGRASCADHSARQTFGQSARDPNRMSLMLRSWHRSSRCWMRHAFSSRPGCIEHDRVLAVRSVAPGAVVTMSLSTGSSSYDAGRMRMRFPHHGVAALVRPAADPADLPGPPAVGEGASYTARPVAAVPMPRLPLCPHIRLICCCAAHQYRLCRAALTAVGAVVLETAAVVKTGTREHETARPRSRIPRRDDEPSACPQVMGRSALFPPGRAQTGDLAMATGRNDASKCRR
jgi:hypothetical protein